MSALLVQNKRSSKKSLSMTSVNRDSNWEWQPIESRKRTWMIINDLLVISVTDVDDVVQS